MTSDLIFKIVITENKKEIFSKSLGYETVVEIVHNHPDEEGSNDFFKLVAQHPASSVREVVAGKSTLSDEVAGLLSKDDSIKVLRVLTFQSEAFKTIATDELLESYIKLKDSDLTRNIAQAFHEYKEVNLGKIAALLKKATDPEVRRALADNSEIPIEITMDLLEDSDATVKEAAKNSLMNR